MDNSCRYAVPFANCMVFGLFWTTQDDSNGKSTQKNAKSQQ